MMQALELLLQFAKRHVSGDATLISEEIKPVAITIIKLHLSKGLYYRVSTTVLYYQVTFILRDY